MTGNNRCSTSSLEAPHNRTLGCNRLQNLTVTVGVRLRVLLVALPVRGNVTRVANRQQVVIGSVTQGVNNLEGTGLLTLNTVGVHRVHQEHRVVLAELASNLQAVVEVAVNLNDVSTVSNRLRQLTHRNLAVRNQHCTAHTSLQSVRSSRSGSVTGRSTHNSLRTVTLSGSHRAGHTAVLERTGRVHTLKLQVNGVAGLSRQCRRVNQRGTTLAQGHSLHIICEGQTVTVLIDNALPHVCHWLLLQSWRPARRTSHRSGAVAGTRVS